MDNTNKSVTTIVYGFYWELGAMLCIAFLLGSEWLLGYLPDGWVDEINRFCIVPMVLFIFEILSERNRQTEAKPKAIDLTVLPWMWGLVVSIVCISFAIAVEVEPTWKTVLPISLLLLFDAVFAIQILQGKFTVYAGSFAEKS